MITKHLQRADEEIIPLLLKNDLVAWEYLYDKYCPILYGKILQMVSGKELAEEILIKAFVQFKEVEIFSDNSASLFIRLFRHTHLMAIQHLKSKGIAVKTLSQAGSDYPILDRFVYLPGNCEDAAMEFGINKDEIRKQLYEEVKLLRSRMRLVK